MADCLFVLLLELFSAYILLLSSQSCSSSVVYLILVPLHSNYTRRSSYPLQPNSAPSPSTSSEANYGEVQSWLLRGEGWFAGINYRLRIYVCAAPKEKKKKKKRGAVDMAGCFLISLLLGCHDNDGVV